MTRVLAVDAGQSTGLAVVDFPDGHPPEVRHMVQFVVGVAASVTLIGTISSEERPDVLIAEQFDLRPHNTFVADLTPVEINGALKYVFGDSIVWQTPAQAKGLVKDQVLKNLGMWPTGKTVGQEDANDARDALRHAIHYGATVLKHQPTLQLGWPRES